MVRDDRTNTRPETGSRPDGADLARSVHHLPGVGLAAHVLQGRELRILRVRVELPALVLVDRGIKTVTPEHGTAATARPGQALVIGGNQSVDFVNTVADGAHYEARWLVFGDALLDDAFYRAEVARVAGASRGVRGARALARVGDGLAAAFERARDALSPDADLPPAIARQRMLEVLHWLLHHGVVLQRPAVEPGALVRARALIAGRLEQDWTTDRVATELAMSAATLRRRLAAEGATFAELLVDARMSMALTLLQATAQPVASIALAVGYDSASRFAVRFRQRFGFAPSEVRGHERPAPIVD
jgi:AraC-like DNA-binding protein